MSKSVYRKKEFQNHPDVIRVCQQCRYADCIGTCEEYREAIKRLEDADAQREAEAEPAPAPTFCRGDLLEFKGEALTIAEWSRRTGVSPHTIRYRYARGWPMEKVLDRNKYAYSVYPKEHRHGGGAPAAKYTFRGRAVSVREVAEMTGISAPALRHRIEQGMTLDEAVKVGRRKHTWPVLKGGKERCDACGKAWGEMGADYKFCPECGLKIDHGRRGAKRRKER